MRARSIRLSPLGVVCLGLAACLRPPLTGEEASGADATTVADASTTASSSTSTASTPHDTAEPPATASGPATAGSGDVDSGDVEPMGCGDGVVGDDELCDDGNTAPDDGCSPACRPAGRLLWTRVRAEPPGHTDGWFGVAVAPDGRVILVGNRSDDSFAYDLLISTYGKAGDLLWERVIPGETEETPVNLLSVALGADGTIFTGGFQAAESGRQRAVLLAFTSAGDPLWTFAEPLVLEHSSWVFGVDIADGVLVSAGTRREDIGDGTVNIVVRRHDPLTGAELWQRVPATNSPHADAQGVALAADRLLVAGTSWDPLGQGRYLAAYDLAGELLWSEEAEPASSTAWTDARRIGDDFVVTGHAPGQGNDLRLLLRRIGPDGAEKWTYQSDLGLDLVPSRVAVGPDEELAVVARSLPGDHRHAWTLRLAGDGTVRWMSDDEGSAGLGAWGAGVAIGAGLIAVCGDEDTADVWVSEARVRVFAFE